MGDELIRPADIPTKAIVIVLKSPVIASGCKGTDRSGGVNFAVSMPPNRIVPSMDSIRYQSYIVSLLKSMPRWKRTKKQPQGSTRLLGVCQMECSIREDGTTYEDCLTKDCML